MNKGVTTAAIYFFILLFPQLALAQDPSSQEPVYLISDIDDTIRVTNVLDFTDLLRNGIKTSNAFLGMSELYNFLACADLKDGVEHRICLNYHADNRSENRKVAYVTGSPGDAQIIAKEFLDQNAFPNGSFFGRDPSAFPYPIIGIIDALLTRPTYDFKVETISRLLSAAKNTNIVLVGDNGEHDVRVFDTISSWASLFRPDLKVRSFVHLIYNQEKGHALFRGQTPFVTAADLGVAFFNAGWISERELSELSLIMKRELHENPDQIFPEWMDCSDIKSNQALSPILPTIASDLRENLYSIYETTVQRCQN